MPHPQQRMNASVLKTTWNKNRGVTKGHAPPVGWCILQDGEVSGRLGGEGVGEWECMLRPMYGLKSHFCQFDRSTIISGASGRDQRSRSGSTCIVRTVSLRVCARLYVRSGLIFTLNTPGPNVSNGARFTDSSMWHRLALHMCIQLCCHTYDGHTTSGLLLKPSHIYM